MPVHPDPWPGESLTYYDALVAAPVVDTQLWRDVWSRAGTGRTITAGDVWHVYYEADASWSDRYLDDPDVDVVVSWVVEVNSGSGTLAASEGTSTSPDPGDTAPTSLGAQTVTGPATVVFPSVLMSAAEVVNTGPLRLLRLEATSGSLDVRQVKLRVWPTTGAGGGWSDLKPSWDGEPQNATMYYHAAQVLGEGEGATAEAAYAAAADNFAANYATQAADQPRGMTSSGAMLASQNTGVVDLDTYGSAWILQAVLAVAVGADWHGDFPIDTATFVEGVDWTRPPEEVPGDTAVVAQQVGDGSTGWVNAVARVSPAYPTSLGGFVTFHTSAGEIDDVDPGSGVEMVLPIPTGSAVTAETVYPLVTTGRDLFFAVSHQMPGDFDLGSVTAALDPGADGNIQTFATYPPYRLWDFTGSPHAPTSKLRQIFIDDGRGTAPPAQFAGLSAARTGRAFGDR